MTTVAKYNTCKAVSTVLTFGTPIITLAASGDLFIHQADTAISAAGIFAILLSALFAKDKIAEQFKAPSGLVVAIVVLVLTLFLEHLLVPIKYVCFATICACGVDELTFKAWYKQAAKGLPASAEEYKHIGFIWAKWETLQGEDKPQSESEGV